MNQRLRILLYRCLKTAYLGIFVICLSGYFSKVAHVALATSPLIALGDLLSWKSVSLAIFWGVPLVVLAFLKHRFFCEHLCPFGTLLDHFPDQKKHPLPNNVVQRRFGWLKLPTFVFLTTLTVVSSINLLGFFDPLALSARFIGLFQYPPQRMILLLSIPMAFIFLLNVFNKRFWCKSLCPLGTLFDLAYGSRCTLLAYRHGAKEPARVPAGISRRAFITTAAAGMLGGCGLFFTKRKHTPDLWLVRPPGASSNLTEECIRCGNCMKACPTHGLFPTTLQAGWAGMLTPHLVSRIGYCEKFCTACMDSCPTGALKKLTLEEKFQHHMGLAYVNRKRCLAWSNTRQCMICQQHCPYDAIRVHVKPSGMVCPVVVPKKCVGCGLCEHVCPVYGQNAAIRVARPGLDRAGIQAMIQ